ncbi:MAG TPA: pyridoxal phosphate-dependent aminotransferase [Acidimicrobiales bacterium]|jgi:aspartate/methionine/tyrosine aminotransferase|nr:aspartate aminotransferase [Actinomycetota bacterium]MDP6062021.1 pyridoxal phosphate-dependent aminotransferase [Acidimicrobiales bacterium]MDP7209916.1 pyridoxal phosphate-dependent aminotransferase [Acidimicrobiales bacterium]HJL89353.1 pyridoxal phosphate-dependent aminotransferase [Acidimicrobiales bacterium]HJP00114.1 pyridoxal phosphate-dependent aminotransferase [Acidimicrobiales bacterium]|tara:strand:- start:15283 stop:16482 length:1200 start_codon:yes stop_codon:yes gene_type:complete
MTTQRLSARVGAIAESATMAVTNKARELRAAGEPVIGFGAGEPDFPTPDHIVAAAVAACGDPVNHKYSAAGGLPELKAALVEKTQRDSGWRPEVSQVLVTNGGKHAVYNSCAALLNPGDEVLLPAPYWTTYPECIALAGGTSVVLQTDVASGFRVTVDQLEAARTPDTKALFFVSPSNPSGAVYPADEIRAIGQWAHEHGIWVIADEIYEHLTYDGHEHHSIRALVPDLADTCVVLNGVAKTYAMTGWRVGWMIGPADLVKAAANLQSHATSNVANVSQRAALAAVAGDLTDVVAMRGAFDRRRVAMSGLLRQIDGLELLEPQGAFYAYPDMSALLGRDIAGRTASTTNELAGIILDEAKVAIVPGEAFGTPGYARLSFALGDADLEEGLTRVVDLLNR